MAMLKGVDKVVGAEGFDFNLLKDAVKTLNDAEVLAKPIKTVAVSKPVLVDNFIKGIESVPEGSDEEKKIPAEVVNLYNSYVDVIEDKVVGLEAAAGKKEAPEKSGKGGKKKVVKKEKGPLGTKSDYIRELVGEGKHTQKEIMGMVQGRFPDSSRAGTSSTISHAKAEANVLGKRIAGDQGGVLSFVEG